MNHNELNTNKKGSKKGIKNDGKYTPSKKQKAQHLETYKNKPCYNLLFKCQLCDASYIKINESNEKTGHKLTNKDEKFVVWSNF